MPPARRASPVRSGTASPPACLGAMATCTQFSATKSAPSLRAGGWASHAPRPAVRQGRTPAHHAPNLPDRGVASKRKGLVSQMSLSVSRELNTPRDQPVALGQSILQKVRPVFCGVDMFKIGYQARRPSHTMATRWSRRRGFLDHLPRLLPFARVGAEERRLHGFAWPLPGSAMRPTGAVILGLAGFIPSAYDATRAKTELAHIKAEHYGRGGRAWHAAF